MKTARLASILLCVLAVGLAQSYRCDWCVNGIGGGEMVSSAYKCGATAGQTAAGLITNSNYWALIGFWQPEGQTGVREQANSPNQGPLVTHLYSPFPTPAVRNVTIRYSLATEGLVTLRVHDLTGRVVRTLCASSMKRGAYCVTWNGADDRGQELARGVYFCRFSSDDYRATEKLVLQR